MKAGLVVLFLNFAAFCVGFFTDFNAPDTRLIFYWTAAIFALFAILIVRGSGKIREFVVNIQSVILACFFCIFMFEMLFKLIPAVFPENIQRLVETDVMAKNVRVDSVELLNHNP